MNLIIETNRLLLRPLELSDAEAMFAMDNNPKVHKYLWQNPTQTIEETIKIIGHVQSQYQRKNIGRFATILKETGEFLGWTGIKFVDDHVENGNTNFYDYGYRLDEKFWNKGYATEASIAWLDYFFNKMTTSTPEASGQCDKLNAYTHAENAASNHILQKIGMNFMEDYPDESGAIWKWWQISRQSQ